MPNIKAPYAAATVLILMAVTLFLMAEGSVDGTAFKVGAVLMGGLVTRAAIAVAVGAPITATLMVFVSAVVLACAVAMLSADTFKDQAIEGAAVFMMTGALMVVGEFLERHRDRPTVVNNAQSE